MANAENITLHEACSSLDISDIDGVTELIVVLDELSKALAADADLRFVSRPHLPYVVSPPQSACGHRETRRLAIPAAVVDDDLCGTLWL